MDLSQKFIGKVLDKRYKIIKILGVGGMSVVFEAYDVVYARNVAVKVLKDELCDDEQTIKRFVNESLAVSMLNHPNIVKVHDVSVKSRLKYIVMERVEGITLKSYMQRKGVLSSGEILSYAEQILAALSHAHQKGIYHRDIKPQNILLLRSGKVKISDFGIAAFENAEEPTEKKAIGTVYYISPEQAAGKKIDGRTDLYSLGVMMYEMATGKLPFDADTPLKIARMHITDQPKSPRSINPNIPIGLEQVIMTAMEKEPERRFATAEQMEKYVSKLRTSPDYIFKLGKKKAETSDESKTTMAKGKTKKKKKSESRSMFPIICGVTLAFLVVFATAALYLIDQIMKDENANAPETIEVPSVVGEIYGDELKKMLDSSVYKIIVETKYDSSSPENTVIKQDPAAGSKRKVLKDKQYCTITLTVSKGSQMISVPDLTITDYRSAKLKAEKLGLKVALEEVSNDYVEIGYVISTSPSSGEKVAVGTTITIKYSKGSAATKFSVPTLTNMTPSQAYSKMNGNFAVGKVTYEYSSKISAGKIVSQSIPSGTKAVKGTPIDFVISLGPEPVVTEPEPIDPAA
ncbi:MAG: Stk1 family PASTA domain-containing Ser/Thr kinase [Firmicutes bacterium]|nr:Stk1 family PASTA domain-containing Ser/Thr kinase [Candidatus Colimorpha enterica]